MRLSKLDRRDVCWDFSKFVDRNCPFCFSQAGNTSYIRPDGCSVKKCDRCSAYFVSPGPTEELLTAFYSSYHHTYFGGEASLDLGLIRKKYGDFSASDDLRLSYLRRDMSRSTNYRYSLLDFGCGTGEFMYRARSLGAEVYGADIDEFALDVCRGVGIDNVYTPDELFSQDFAEKFDLISLNDFLEHPLHPDALMGRLCLLLKPGGRILIWTPNGDFIENDESKVTLRVDLEHMQYCSSGAVMELCKRHGLSVCYYVDTGFPSKSNFVSVRRFPHFLSKVRSIVFSFFPISLLASPIRVMFGFVRRKFWVATRTYFGVGYHLLFVLRKM